MWIGYAQPMIDGNHEMCDYWNDGRRMTQSTDPIRLEPADFFFVMFRVEEKQITRIRTYSANCPLDAGGKAVHWFTNVSVNDSVNYMKTFMSPNATRKMNDSALTVLALTEGDQPLNELLTLAESGPTAQIKGQALFWLAQRAGQKAIGTITAAIENDPDTEGEGEGGVRAQPAAEGRGRAAADPAGAHQQEPRRPQAGDVLARPVEGSQGAEVLRRDSEIDRAGERDRGG